MQAATSPETIPAPPTIRSFLTAEQQRNFNAGLRPGFRVAVIRPPGQRPRLIVEKMARGSSGRPPRRPVQIPQPVIMQAGLRRESKHARQRQKQGCYSNQGGRTIALKDSIYRAACEMANKVARLRREIRKIRTRFGATVEGARSIFDRLFQSGLFTGAAVNTEANAS